jgi:sugar/nucleoside kinase (ribokinase family)
MDRLLSVASYPNADVKIRSTSSHEVGGGNAANTASAIARLSKATLANLAGAVGPIQVKLLTKLGDDSIRAQLCQELKYDGVDLSSPLFMTGGKGSSTSVTTVIVSDSEQTRTCIYTPGSCGELTQTNVADVDMDEVFRNVVHVHSDTRHTGAALILAREARRRGLPISVDAEKDRKSAAMDELLDLATIIFSNQDQLRAYLDRRIQDNEANPNEFHLSSPLPPVTVIGEYASEELEYVHALIKAADLLHVFQYWLGEGQLRKELVLTR